LNYKFGLINAQAHYTIKRFLHQNLDNALRFNNNTITMNQAKNVFQKRY